MEKYTLDHDIPLVCLTASAFPEGIEAAYMRLDGILPAVEGRRYYGISWPDKEGVITYKAAAAECQPGEAEKLGCETYVLQKGEYINILISDYVDDTPSISRAFEQLLADKRIDPHGCCVEMYLGKNGVRCMVRLNSLNPRS